MCVYVKCAMSLSPSYFHLAEFPNREDYVSPCALTLLKVEVAS